MSRISRKKKSLVLVVAALALIGGGVAYAFWTAGGSGTGTAATATSTTALTVNQTSVITGMYPGDSAQTLSGTFTNTNTGPVYVTAVTASIASVTKAAGAPAGTCDTTDYTLTGAVMTVGHEVAVGTGVDSWTGAAIHFNNKATNQDACKGATVNLAYSIS
jgi:hypothetical protein